MQKQNSIQLSSFPQYLYLVSIELSNLQSLHFNIHKEKERMASVFGLYIIDRKISQHIFLSIIYKCNTTHTHKCAFSIQHITQKTIYLNVYRSKQYFLSSLQFIKNSLERDSSLLFLSFCFLNIKSYHKEYYN